MDLPFMTAWLDDLLDPKSFNDFCVNGLCVEANDKVTRIVTGVSLRDQLIDAAIEEKADCIIVHHPNGFWKGESQIPVGKFGERLRKLMCNGISVFGFHLPLDGHREIGNNAMIAKILGLKPVHEFMYEGTRAIGVIAEWNTPATREEFLDKCIYIPEIRILNDNDKFITANPEHRGMVKNMTYYAAQSFYRNVSVLMPETVIYLLEEVQINHDDSEF